MSFEKFLSGGDLRSLGESRKVLPLIKGQSDFDELITFLENHNRLNFTPAETGKVWNILTQWVTDRNESKIVRVNALQSLFIIQKQHPQLQKDFSLIVAIISREQIPSLNARIRKLITEKKKRSLM